MPQHVRTLLALACAALALGCGDAATGPHPLLGNLIPGTDVRPVEGDAFDLPVQDLGGGARDIPESDILLGDDPGNSAEGGGTVEPGQADEGGPGAAPLCTSEGGFGCPCESNDDCFNPFCISSSLGRICTKACIDDCPSGFECREVVLFGTDPSFVCVDTAETLCSPCREHADCRTQQGGDGALCMDFGPEGSFCGAPCGDGCPVGFACVDFPGPTGRNQPQCVPETGECHCTPRAVELGRSTTCAVRNQWGECTGDRSCTPEGLTACEAPTPSLEICDGVDNNCDGTIDNLDSIGVSCPLSNEFGTCPGTPRCEEGRVVCIGDMPSPEFCDGKDNDCDGVIDNDFPDTDRDGISDCLDDDDDNDGVIDPEDNCQIRPNPQQEDYDNDGMGDICDNDDDNDTVADEDDCDPFNNKNFPGNLEVCDGLDNNCNGQQDEGLCDDGNSCTQDACDPGGGCDHRTLNGVPCNDGTVCTQVDICQNGECIGGNPMRCEDGNPCTTDICNPVTGCFFEVSTDGCEDGNVCTVGDTCRNGQCISGPIKNCDDGNPCTVEDCDPHRDCLYLPRDNAPCVANSRDCPLGECVAGTCLSKNGATCQTEVDYGLCDSVDVPGTCDSNGRCTPQGLPPNRCGGCQGICIDCIIPICVPFSIFF